MHPAGLSIRPIFATPIVTGTLEGDSGITVEKIEQYEFCPEFRGQSRTNSMTVLRDFPALEASILDSFEFVKQDILCTDQEFVVSSSWFTRMKPEATNTAHRHPNSFYSGVFYPFDTPYSPLGFRRTGLEDESWFVPPQTENVFNTLLQTVVPHQNFLVMFPSNVYHEVAQNTDSRTRYSLAFNLFPVGRIAAGDSSINISVHPFD